MKTKKIMLSKAQTYVLLQIHMLGDKKCIRRHVGCEDYFLVMKTAPYSPHTIGYRRDTINSLIKKNVLVLSYVEDIMGSVWPVTDEILMQLALGTEENICYLYYTAPGIKVNASVDINNMTFNLDLTNGGIDVNTL